jgi:hypothetical protein
VATISLLGLPSHTKVLYFDAQRICDGLLQCHCCLARRRLRLGALSGWRAAGGLPDRFPRSRAAGGEGWLKGTARGDMGERRGDAGGGSREKWLYCSLLYQTLWPSHFEISN